MKYYISCGSYTRPTFAYDIKDELISLGFKNINVSFNQGQYFVTAGMYGTREEVNNEMKKLSNSWFPAMITMGF